MHFSDKNLNFIGQLFNDNGNIKPWEGIKTEFRLKDTHQIYWLQIIDALPKSWNDVILKDKENAKNLVIFYHRIVRKSHICSLNKLTSKELYLILVDKNTVKSTAQDYFENLFQSCEFTWKKMYFLIRNTTLDTKVHMFQCKVLHNILYVNKMLFKFGKVKDVYIYSFGFLSIQFYLILCLTKCNTKFVFFCFILLFYFCTFFIKGKKVIF